jgi:hypothetical protein
LDKCFKLLAHDHRPTQNFGEQRDDERCLLADDPARTGGAKAEQIGMRSGELRGLQWRDVDWKAGTVTVRRSLQRLDGVFLAVEQRRRRADAPCHYRRWRSRRSASTTTSRPWHP